MILLNEENNSTRHKFGEGFFWEKYPSHGFRVFFASSEKPDNTSFSGRGHRVILSEQGYVS
ncbi:MAG: hypothetical protein GX801_08180 [Fibrobacter sp.]|nr:hypothetical protein [Fibrobacter sp.]